jgi:hypothetical protein
LTQQATFLCLKVSKATTITKYLFKHRISLE